LVEPLFPLYPEWGPMTMPTLQTPSFRRNEDNLWRPAILAKFEAELYS
jgi:hypothetical protein